MASPDPAPQQPVEAVLVRQLGLFDTTMVIVGIVIGSGIFLTTGLIAQNIPSAPLIMLVWLIGGLHALTGALTYAELGAAMPHAGGQYVYLREAYGPFVGFLFGWITFFAYMTGIIAALGVAFAEYFGYFFPALSIQNVLFATDLELFGRSFAYRLSAGQLVGLLLIGLFSYINYRGTAFGKAIQNISTVTKIGALAAFVLFGLLSDRGMPVDWRFNPRDLDFGQLAVGIGLSFVAVSWTVGGWQEVTFISGEIKQPERNIPRALAIGTGSITLLYLLINYVYLRALPLDVMAGVVRVGEVASNALFGEMGAALLSVAVMLSVLGAMNGTVLVGPRVYYAMARDGLFFRRAGQIHPQYGTPGLAIGLQAIWAGVLTLTGTFGDLITFVIFANAMLWVAAATAVFTLRAKRPEMPRPYRVWGYPAVPLFFVVASSGIMLNMLLETPVQALASLMFIAIGIPVYFLWSRQNRADQAG